MEGPEEQAAKGVVVVGVDDSEGARRALRCAAQVARERGWKLLVVHAWHVMYPTAPFLVPPVDIEPAARAAAEATVAKIEEDVFGSERDIEIEERVAEAPAAELLVEASKEADLLVVGSRGRGGFASLTLGSVSSACVHHAHCPVLVLRGR